MQQETIFVCDSKQCVYCISIYVPLPEFHMKDKTCLGCQM